MKELVWYRRLLIEQSPNRSAESGSRLIAGLHVLRAFVICLCDGPLRAARPLR